MDSPQVQFFDKSVQERPHRKDVDSIDKHRWQAGSDLKCTLQPGAQALLTVRA
jgi:hypothetical protein